MAVVYDSLAAIFSWLGAFLLRFNFDVPVDQAYLMYKTFLLLIPIQIITFYFFGLYRRSWRFSSIPDLRQILFSVITSSFVTIVLLVMFKLSVGISRAVLVLNPILLLLIMGGGRFIYRTLKEYYLYGSYKISGKPIIILGANEAAAALIKDLNQNKDWHVVGILDDDSRMHNREILGVRVFGDLKLLSFLKQRFSANHLIIVMPPDNHLKRRTILNSASNLGMNILTIPNIGDLISGKFNISEIQKIEIEDLLGRESVKLDNHGLNDLIENQAVMVTGAAGSIGSELCRQIIKFNPKILICFDLSESSLFRLEQDLHKLTKNSTIIYLVGNIRDIKRTEKILSLYSPKIVFHAAAYKHVPLMESGNVIEAINNNTLGTYLLAKTCQKLKIEKFVLVSTDKAVNPTNVMGATKKMAELVCQGLQKNQGTKFIIVRFGNVLGSSGSVIPKFREQIKLGGPITITHPEISRYFMSIPEASQLILQAGSMGQGGEVFILDMGDPVKIRDLAIDMIKLSGFDIKEIKIKYVGLRPGEKLFEELIAENEKSIETLHPKLKLIKPRTIDRIYLPGLINWIDSIQDCNDIQIKKGIMQWLKNYSPDLKKYFTG